MKLVRSLVALAVTGIALTSCTQVHREACSALAPGRADAAVELLTPGMSNDLMNTVDQLRRDPAPVFASKVLGLKTQTGVVVLATYDAQGQVAVRGAFNLGGVATGDLQRKADAKQQSMCLATAGGALRAPAPDHVGGDLLRALPGGVAQAQKYSGTGRILIAAFGFGSSGGDGLVVNKADLSTPAARANVLGQLLRYQLIPDLGHLVGVVLVAPGAGVASGIGAAGVNAFAEDLCTHLDTSLCRPSPDLS